MSLTATVTLSSGPWPVAGRLTEPGTQQAAGGASSGMPFPSTAASPIEPVNARLVRQRR